MRLYLCGRITGDRGYAGKFDRYEKSMRALGFDVVNPTTLPQELSYDELLAKSMDMLLSCDAIYLIPDWIDSYGAKREYMAAVDRGMLIISECEQAMYICDPIKAAECDKQRCYIRAYNMDRRCAFTPRREWARTTRGGAPIEATEQLIDDYVKGIRV